MDILLFETENNELTGSLPSEMGNLESSESLWLSKFVFYISNVPFGFTY